MSGIFISYRREDSTPYARLLSDSLGEHFGSHLVFRDVDTMGPGVDFPTAIAEAVNECDVLLALIGEKWLTAELHGHRRLDDENDYVRLEIQAALDRGILVVPVLLEATRMPSRSELPESLVKLADRNAHRLTDESWNYGVDRLVEALRKVVAPPPPAPAAPPPSSVATPASSGPPSRSPPQPAPVSPDRPPLEAPATGAPPGDDRTRTVTILAVVGVVVVLAVIGLALAMAGGGGDGDGGETEDTTEVVEDPATEAEATFELSPSVAAQDATVTAVGDGFQPGETIQFTVDGENVGETTADGDGHFEQDTPVAPLETGSYEVRAEGMESGRTAVASLEVE